MSCQIFRGSNIRTPLRTNHVRFAGGRDVAIDDANRHSQRPSEVRYFGDQCVQFRSSDRSHQPNFVLSAFWRTPSSDRIGEMRKDASHAFRRGEAEQLIATALHEPSDRLSLRQAVVAFTDDE